jgi:hypothetical protein
MASEVYKALIDKLDLAEAIKAVYSSQICERGFYPMGSGGRCHYCKRYVCICDAQNDLLFKLVPQICNEVLELEFSNYAAIREWVILKLQDGGIKLAQTDGHTIVENWHAKGWIHRRAIIGGDIWWVDLPVEELLRVGAHAKP